MVVFNVRMPDEARERLREWARAEGRSLNDLTVEILDRESRRWVARRALSAAGEARETIRRRVGDLPDSAPLIREMREERLSRA